MLGSLESPFPLQAVTRKELQKLCNVLWSWEICETCSDDSFCNVPGCSWKRSTRLERFFRYYKEVTSSYVPELLPGSRPALRSHDDIFNIIRLIKSKPSCTRSELEHTYFSQRDDDGKQPPLADQHRAFNVAVKVMAMVTCSTESQPAAQLELGMQPIVWHTNTSFEQFISLAFPQADMGDLNITDESGKTRDIKPSLTARRLKKVAQLRFRRTDDLRNHLRLDATNGIVEIYHFTSVLKEHLAASREVGDDSAVVNLFPENILRQVALEALESVQTILFPFDSSSELILRQLVSKENCDPDCLRYDGLAYRICGEEISYKHFGSRLLELYEEVENPSPRGYLEKWLERKSGARYVMMATLIGVIIAVLLGILGLGVGIFQAWVAYEAWKYPVNNLQ